MIIKYWAKQRKITNNNPFVISSYAVTLMVINYLQCIKPPLLPCLQEIEKKSNMINGYNCYFYNDLNKLKKFGSSNKTTVGELLLGFYFYFSQIFDWYSSVISVRTGRCLTKSEKKWTARKEGSKDFFFFTIEDPFDIDNNLGKQVSGEKLKFIQNEFERAYKLLSEKKSLDVILELKTA